MIAPAAQEHSSDQGTLWQHLDRLPALQRKALLLVGAQGLTYVAAAEVMGCEDGTVKSRVSRAHMLLAEKLGMGPNGLWHSAGQAAAVALLAQTRRNCVQAIRLRAEAGAKQHLKMVGWAESDVLRWDAS